MRKYLIGLISGIVLASSISVFAEGTVTTVKNLIGLQVTGQFPVTINGAKIDEPAAVIVGADGEPRGYLPIRAVGDALGVVINFDQDLGILVEGTVSESVYTERVAKLETDKIALQEEVAELKRQRHEQRISENKAELDAIQRQGNLELLAAAEKRLKALEGELQFLTNEAGRPQLEADKKKIEEEIAALKAKLGLQ